MPFPKGHHGGTPFPRKPFVTEKPCTICKVVLSLDSFYKAKVGWGGRQSRCKDCHREKVRVKADASPEFREKIRRNRHSYTLRDKFGMTLADYDKMHEAQQGLCAICHKPETKVSGTRGTVKRLSLDHNHATGKARGLLCMRCNTAIAMFDEDAYRFGSAVRYLAQHA